MTEQEMIEFAKCLALKVARRYPHLKDDLISESYLQLVKILKRADRPITKTYLRTSILFELRRYVKAQGQMPLKGVYRDATVDTIREAVATCEPPLRASLVQSCYWLTDHDRGERTSTDPDHVQDSTAPDPEETAALRELIEKGLDNLSDHEYDILEAVAMDQSVAAIDPSVSRERMRQRKQSVLDKIRTRIGG